MERRLRRPTSGRASDEADARHRGGRLSRLARRGERSERDRRAAEGVELAAEPHNPKARSARERLLRGGPCERPARLGPGLDPTGAEPSGSEAMRLAPKSASRAGRGADGRRGCRARRDRAVTDTLSKPTLLYWAMSWEVTNSPTVAVVAIVRVIRPINDQVTPSLL